MLSIRGVYQDGVVRPVRPLYGRDGQRVIITFLDEQGDAPSNADAREAVRRVLASSGRLSGLSEGLREKIIPGVTLEEVQMLLSRNAEKSLSTF